MPNPTGEPTERTLIVSGQMTDDDLDAVYDYLGRLGLRVALPVDGDVESATRRPDSPYLDYIWEEGGQKPIAVVSNVGLHRYEEDLLLNRLYDAPGRAERTFNAVRNVLRGTPMLIQRGMEVYIDPAGLRDIYKDLRSGSRHIQNLGGGSIGFLGGFLVAAGILPASEQ